MVRLQGSAVILAQIVMFKLHVLLGKVNSQLELDVTPSKIYRGDTVQLTCTNRVVPVNTTACDISWRQGEPQGSNWKYAPIKEISGRIAIRTYYHGKGRPTHSQLTLHNVDSSIMAPAYECRLFCDGDVIARQTVKNLNIIPENENGSQAKDVNEKLLYVVIGGTLLFLLVGAIMYCRDRINASSNQVGQSRPDVMTRVNTAANDPPRYSLAVHDTDLYPPTDTEVYIGGEHRVSISPPEYEDALKSLKSKGLIIDITKLQPMPPGYWESPLLSRPWMNSSSQTTRL